jgi:hypothetical protein
MLNFYIDRAGKIFQKSMMPSESRDAFCELGRRKVYGISRSAMKNATA